MKINEVEALVNITKKNIRFYEEQGLLFPQRNTENGYRNYSEEDVQTLRQIKLLRKLGVPIEEIRQMLLGVHTLSDGMRLHLISLEREKQNLEHSISFCRNLQVMDTSISSLEIERFLGEMEELEKNGTTFKNKQTSDIRIRYVAPSVITLMMIALISAFIVLIVWGYLSSPADAPPLWFLWICIGVCLALGVGVVLALIQRVREIGKGEIDDAKNY